MSSGRRPTHPIATKVSLNDLLDFGPEPQPQVTLARHTRSMTDRLKDVVKQLQSINERIDKLIKGN